MRAVQRLAACPSDEEEQHEGPDDGFQMGFGEAKSEAAHAHGAFLAIASNLCSDAEGSCSSAEGKVRVVGHRGDHTCYKKCELADPQEHRRVVEHRFVRLGVCSRH